MTKRYLRTEKDFIIESISWLTENVNNHTKAGFKEIPKSIIHRRFNQLVNFLHIKGLTTLKLIENSNQVDDISELKNSDLNDKGFYYLQSCLAKWLGRLDKDNGAEKEWKYLEKWYSSFEKTYELDNQKKEQQQITNLTIAQPNKKIEK